MKPGRIHAGTHQLVPVRQRKLFAEWKMYTMVPPPDLLHRAASPAWATATPGCGPACLGAA
jgi:hypothetical protein